MQSEGKAAPASEVEVDDFQDAHEELQTGSESDEAGPSGSGLDAVEDEKPRRFASLRDKAKAVVKRPSEVPMQDNVAAAYRMPSFMPEDRSESQASLSPANLSLHKAAFEGDVAAAAALLQETTSKQKMALDPQGNSALHVAVLRRKASMVLALLDGGLPPKVESSRRWTPLDEAVALRDRELVKLLHARQTAALKAEMRSKKSDLLDSIAQLPDTSFQLKWELGSPVLGMLLRKYAPNDTYKVWKKGTRLRVDGSLMGLDDKRTSLLPQWKRGHFSLLIDGATTPATMMLCDHAKKRYIDLSKEKKLHKPSLDDEAAMIITEGASRTKMKASEFHFKVAKTWFGNDCTEKIEGWQTRVYEAAGKMVAITIHKKPLQIPADATFEEYLALEVPEDEVDEVPVDPYNMDTPEDKPPIKMNKEQKEKRKKHRQARRLTGRCWMAEDFPMSLKQLLPLLEVIGLANKHIARVGKFLQKYGDMSLFPVKLQVPLIYTVYALVNFRQFKKLEEVEHAEVQADEWYQVPSGYTVKTLDEVTEKRRSRRRASWEEGEPGPPELSAKSTDAQILAQMGL